MTALELAAALFLQGKADAVGEALAADDYRAAWLAMESQEDSALRARQAAEILYAAGDPARALAAARAGLMASPEQLELLFYAAGASIWLQDASTAKEYVIRLRQALELSTGLKPADSEKWQRVVAEFSFRSHDLSLHEEALRSAVLLAKVLTIASLCAGLVLSGLVTRKCLEG